MKNKILVYDDNCPLCSWYTGLFVRRGLLPAEGRKAFSTIDPALLQRIDLVKSRNEIPLLDSDTGKVIYGIDALLDILGAKYGFIKRTGNWPPLKWLLKKLYKLVSYNRKVIVAKKCGAGSIDCAPDLNLFYRFLFLFFSFVFNTLMLFPLHYLLLTRLPYYQVSIQELQWTHLGLVVINCLLAFRFHKEQAIEYIGQVNMLALQTILLLSIPLLLSSLPGMLWLITGCLILTALIIFKEYLRRMEYAGVLPRNKWVASINLACLCAFVLILFG